MEQSPLILCVSLDPEVFRPYREAFSSAGFRAEEIRVGQDLGELFEEAPDLFLVDSHLDGMTGSEFCCRLKTHPATARTPVLHFTIPEKRLETLLEKGCTHAYFAHGSGAAEVLVAAQSLLEAREAERLLESFLEAAPDATVIIDQSGTIVRINGLTNSLFGYDDGELIGQSLEILLPDRFRSRHPVQRTEYFAAPRPRAMGSSSNLFGLKKDGTEFPVDVSLNELPSRSGRFVASAIRDMTRQRALENQLREQWARLEDTDRRKDEALAAVAHELRSPLNSILSNAYVLSNHPAQIDDTRIIGQAMERQGAHMLHLVEDLLDLSQIRSGQAVLNLARCDMAEIIARAVEISQAALDAGGHDLQVSGQSPAPTVQGDFTRLVQVFVNLIGNAARYTPGGGKIRLSLKQADSEVAVSVADNGVGLAPEQFANLFEPFATAGSVRQQGQSGLGLGLAIARQVVQLHGGTIKAFSDGPGCGTTFVVNIPRRRPVEPPVVVPAARG